jgi:hypothetical protein
MVFLNPGIRGFVYFPFRTPYQEHPFLDRAGSLREVGFGGILRGTAGYDSGYDNLKRFFFRVPSQWVQRLKFRVSSLADASPELSTSWEMTTAANIVIYGSLSSPQPQWIVWVGMDNQRLGRKTLVWSPQGTIKTVSL